MYNKIKTIFKSKIIENILDINDNTYYYFYEDHTCQNIFGVKKDISIKEYLMLTTMFIEKKTYFNDKNKQMIAEYLFGSSKYPLKNEVKFLIYFVNDEDTQIVSNVLQDIYPKTIIINYLKYNLAFGPFDSNINDMFKALSSDLGYDIYYNLGYTISQETNRQDILEYINFYDKSIKSIDSTSISDIVILANNKNTDLIKRIANNVVKKIKAQPTYLEIINVLFKNNLNVSLTSKLLYMHRNSVLNKIEQINKITGLDILTFKDAYSIKILLDI